ncbi:origin recognition complex subunit 6 [Manduca sexta]|uniref:origin recognition complex subunit 6 n=1 Tax=Manduca sexta TaxID=7130 RepID=UPI0018901E63|nr:origin recognition complex subunit 6 [Manduca sexta]
MAKHNKTIHLIASKLDLGDEEKVLSKAAEFERLLQTKSIAGSNMTDTSKMVICLELAAGMFGAEFDVKTAIKYSGLKPSMYNNSKKVVQNLLELNGDRLTTNLLCVSLQCSGVQEQADRMLADYCKLARTEVDMNLPQYVCMAVYHACRLNKVKVSKAKLIEKSRLKPSQWTKLDTEWTKFVDANFTAIKKKRGRQPKKDAVIATIEELQIDTIPKEEPSEPQIESYQEWKQRMLIMAYEELKNLDADVDKRDFSLTPRRSPRKTPQKFSPYQNPKNANGVKLLFPDL